MQNLNSFILDSKPLISELIQPLKLKKEYLLQDINIHPIYAEEIEQQYIDACKLKIINFVSESKPELSYEDIITQLNDELIKYLS